MQPWNDSSFIRFLVTLNAEPDWAFLTELILRCVSVRRRQWFYSMGSSNLQVIETFGGFTCDGARVCLCVYLCVCVCVDINVHVFDIYISVKYVWGTNRAARVSSYCVSVYHHYPAVALRRFFSTTARTLCCRRPGCEMKSQCYLYL